MTLPSCESATDCPKRWPGSLPIIGDPIAVNGGLLRKLAAGDKVGARTGAVVGRATGARVGRRVVGLAVGGTTGELEGLTVSVVVSSMGRCSVSGNQVGAGVGGLVDGMSVVGEDVLTGVSVLKSGKNGGWVLVPLVWLAVIIDVLRLNPIPTADKTVHTIAMINMIQRNRTIRPCDVRRAL